MKAAAIAFASFIVSAIVWPIKTPEDAAVSIVVFVMVYFVAASILRRQDRS